MYDFRNCRFGRWNHSDRTEGMCAMEAVAFLAGEPHTDKPMCTCPVIGGFVRWWNAALPSDEERGRWLGPFIWRLMFTRGTRAIQLRRMEMILNWLARERVPAARKLVSELAKQARERRALADNTPADYSTVLWPAWRAIMASPGAACWYGATDSSPSAARSKKSAARLLDRMIRLTEPRDDDLPPAYHQRANELLAQLSNSDAEINHD